MTRPPAGLSGAGIGSTSRWRRRRGPRYSRASQPSRSSARAHPARAVSSSCAAPPPGGPSHSTRTCPGRAPGAP
ncbi:hypothetical protein ACE14D_19090, partial [Streptomyces sp. Act-28]